MTEQTSDTITHGVRVEVQAKYLPAQSAPTSERFVFGYHIVITNESNQTPVQLRNRHWVITDQMGATEEVHGPGVVGHEPTLAIGEAFEYQSGAVLTTPRGRMRGTYEFERPGGDRFDVEVGECILEMPHSLN